MRAAAGRVPGRDASPFELRVDGVAPLLGPFALDLRRQHQVIEVLLPPQ